MLDLVEMNRRRDGKGAILALDLATQCGWAAAHPDGRIASGVWNFSRRKGRHEGDQLVRFKHMLLNFAEGLEKSFSPDGENGNRIGCVVYEEMAAMGDLGSRAARLFGWWEGSLLLWCAVHKITPYTVHPSTLKKFATGDGRASKDDMVAAMRGLGLAPQDHNEADAQAILMWQLALEQGVRK